MGNICGSAKPVGTTGIMDMQATQEEPQTIYESQDLDDFRIPPLLPVPEGLAKPNDSLCEVCLSIKIDATRFYVFPDDQEGQTPAQNPRIDLGLIVDIRKKIDCPLCRLVLAAIGPELASEEDGEPLFATLIWSTERSIRTLNPNIWKGREGKGRHGNTKRLNVYPEITLLANDAPTPSILYYVRPINAYIDFDMVRNWLFMCEDWHGDDCRKVELLDRVVDDPAVEIPSFRLIDVVDNCITFAPRNCAYVALSYVWGRIDPQTILRTLNSNVAALSATGSLTQQEHYEKMPLTIRDAMKVVGELGLRYLWVDSLCIIQDDDGPGGSKFDAISKMDLVYGAAYLTIVAATGTDANAGLPGVYPRPREIPQYIEEVLPGLRLAFRPKYQDYKPSSAYYTRAWTFQEQKFSKRSLTFIGGQAVYVCKQFQWREDIAFEDHNCYYVVPPALQQSVPDDMGRFEQLIQSYSGLSMTYNSDIYHAFAGMGRYFKAELGANFCHGIPDCDFDWFLMWKPLDLEPQQRREGMPSWSWSGWWGQVQPMTILWYTRSMTKIREAHRKRTWIIWYERQAHDSETCHLVWTPEPNTSSKNDRTNFYGIQARTPFEFDCSRTVPTPRKLIGAPQYVHDSYHPIPGSGFLQFWTVSLTLELGEPTSREFPGTGPRNSRARIGMFGRDGHEIGTVIVNTDWRDTNLQLDIRQPHEFILLGEGRAHDVGPQNTGDFDDEKDWKYVAMLIDWKMEGQWAERIAITFIEKMDLDQALGNGPVWKEIVLG